VDPESVIIQSNPQYLLCFWDLRAQKLYVKTLMKLTRDAEHYIFTINFGDACVPLKVKYMAELVPCFRSSSTVLASRISCITP
jgi:hypothetical protein